MFEKPKAEMTQEGPLTPELERTISEALHSWWRKDPKNRPIAEQLKLKGIITDEQLNYFLNITLKRLLSKM